VLACTKNPYSPTMQENRSTGRFALPDRLRPTGGLVRRLALLIVVFTVLVMVSGAIVRLTGSGLGCSDWPTCEEDQFVAALDQPHAVMEFVNRLLSGVLGLPILLVVMATALVRPFRRDLFAWSLALLVGVMCQVVLGAFVVKLKLTPVPVIGHFLLAVIILWAALVLHHRAAESTTTSSARRELVVTSRVHALAWCCAAAATFTVVAGTFVTGTGPHGGDTRASRLPFSILAVVRVHGLAAWCTVALAVVTTWLLYRAGAPATVRRAATWVSGALLVQGALGYLQYFNGVPPVLVGLHVFGATIVWITVVRLVLLCTVPAPARTASEQAARWALDAPELESVPS